MVFFALFFFPRLAFAEPAVNYPARYQVHDLESKVVDNRGRGEERLYGVRNARILFKQIMRGGSNNLYHRDHPRENENPLPDDGLYHLCQEGFTEANYLYSTRFSSAPKEVGCTTEAGTKNTLVYRNLQFGGSPDDAFLKMVRSHLTGDVSGGLYLHCWNGWHASGYVSAISLIQFCDFTQDEAVEYWNRNTDGVNVGQHYESIRQRIRSFLPRRDLAIPPALRDEVCVRVGSRK